MKFTLSWLKEHLDTDAGADEVVDANPELARERHEQLEAGLPFAGFEP